MVNYQDYTEMQVSKTINILRCTVSKTINILRCTISKTINKLRCTVSKTSRGDISVLYGNIRSMDGTDKENVCLWFVNKREINYLKNLFKFLCKTLL